MRLAESIHVKAPPALVWDWVTDPSRYLHFMSGVTRWSVSTNSHCHWKPPHSNAELGGMAPLAAHVS